MVATMGQPETSLANHNAMAKENDQKKARQGMDSYEAYQEAILPNQKASLAELQQRFKYSKYNLVSESDKDIYFQVSCRPITVKAENDMELLSDVVSWGERYLENWDEGVYNCSRCARPLYHSRDKWKGPCVWPSFRKPIQPTATSTGIVHNYNGYQCEVREVYCGGCDLFIGHQFEDGVSKGDKHPEAHWRH